MHPTLEFRIPVRDWASSAVHWLFETAEVVFTAPPFWLVIIVLAAIAFFAKSWKLALASALGFLLIFGMDQWDNAMATIALVLVASLIATLMAIPLGIWAARNGAVSKAVRPVQIGRAHV